jgi:hypothetical protein
MAVSFGKQSDHAVISLRIEEGEMRHRPKQLELLRSLLAAVPAGLVHTFADALVSLTNALQNWIVGELTDERSIPLFSFAPGAGRDVLAIKPVGDLGVRVTPFQARKPFVVDWLRLGRSLWTSASLLAFSGLMYP